MAISSCIKDSPPLGGPGIAFIHDSGYVYRDTSLVIGDHIKVGIDARDVYANITFFHIAFDNGKVQTMLDSGMNRAGLRYTFNIIKSQSAEEKWIFMVMDRNRFQQSIEIVLHKADSNHYGNIITYNNISLGAQGNPSDGSFLSLANGRTSFLDSAYAHQSLVDIIYYFGQYDGTFSSPSEAEAPTIFTGPEGIAGWAIKNETRYDTTALTTQLFDEATNDSLLLAVYEPTAGKRKAKYLAPGMVISFKSPLGKIGLIKVSETVPGVAGSIKVSVKVQE